MGRQEGKNLDGFHPLGCSHFHITIAHLAKERREEGRNVGRNGKECRKEGM